MRFIEVKGIACNSQGGSMLGGAVRPGNFHINLDIVPAIKDNKVYLIKGDVLKLGMNHYKDITLKQVINISDL